MRLAFAIYIIIIIFLFTSCKKDVLHWKSIQQLNSNTTSRLNRIQFVDNNICIIAGGEKFTKAEMLVSTDGGYTWADNSFLEVGKGMYGLGVSPSGNIYASGVDAKVLYSRDKGMHWQNGFVSEYGYYVGISFPTDNIGYMVYTIGQDSGAIVRIDNNLHAQDVKKYKAGLNNIRMADPATGYTIGYGILLKTTDSGNTWSYTNIKGYDNYKGIDIHSKDDVWLCGTGGSIFHTTDGATWQQIRNGNDITKPRYRLQDIAFKPDNITGWAVDDNGILIATDDGGDHWAEFERFTDKALYSIVICPNGDLLVAGDGGALFRITP